MCLILFAHRVHPAYPLVVAANRDEWFRRPTAPAGFWPDAPEVLAGRDLEQQGTWLGVTRAGRFAALTNYRDPGANRPDAPSRGTLVSAFLRSRIPPGEYLEHLRRDASRYNGFSLLVGDFSELLYFSNRDGASRLTPGIHGISNHLLDTPWPKVARGKQALEALVAEGRDPSPEELLALLASRSRPPDESLPETGVGLEWERVLSPLFIESPSYGTRCSTVVLIDRDGMVTFVERVFNGGSEPWLTSRFDFRITGAEGNGRRTEGGVLNVNS